MKAEAEILEALRENLDAQLRALAIDEWCAMEALARDEARLMDNLRAIWLMRAGH